MRIKGLMLLAEGNSDIQVEIVPSKNIATHQANSSSYFDVDFKVILCWRFYYK